MQKLRASLEYKTLYPVLSFLIVAAFMLFGILIFDPFNSLVNVSKILISLPEDDKDALECLFRYLNSTGGFYVLFGNKPMCISSFLEIEPNYSPAYKPNDLMDLSCRLSLPILKINKGWDVWQKYEHFFPSTNFLLLANRDSECKTIFLINKYAFRNKIEENIDVFRGILGDHVTPDLILHNCLKSSNIIGDVLKNSEYLLGILLGFGRHNAQLFSRKSQIEREREPGKISLTKINLIPSPGFSNLEEEYSHIKKTLSAGSEGGIPDFNPLLMSLPGFMADFSHPESQHLKDEYKRQYKYVVRQYKKGDFLEITLNKYCR